MSRSNRVRLPALLICASISFASYRALAAPIPSEQLDRFYANWERALAERAERLQVSKPSEPRAPALSATQGREPAGTADDGRGSSITAGGERIPLRSNPPTASISADEPAPDLSVGAATAEGTASTQSPLVNVPAPSPTPGLMAIKVAKVVGGKIVEVEVLVTPTPGPAPATATAQAQAPSVTGEMAILQNQLKMAATAGKKRVKFSRGQLRNLLTEFQSARSKNPDFDKILPRSKALQVQATLQRSSSLAQGAEMPPEIARSLLRILFPPPKPTAPPQSQPGPPSAPQNEGEDVYTEDNYYVEEGTEGGQPEIYIDPQTGQEVYWDGSPVYSEEEYAEEYYEEGGEENEEGEVYYEEEGGEVYYEEEPYYEEESSEEEYSDEGNQR
jgi:hypothetical protein